MIPTPNDGTRPSKLELDRYAAGELSADEMSALEARLDDRARAHLDALEAARSSVPKLDIAALRARAAASAPEAANDNRGWLAAVGLFLVAAIALFLFLQPSEPEIAFRTGDALTIHQSQGYRLFDYAPGTPVGLPYHGD